MKNLSTKKCVEQKDCTAFEVGEMSDEDLTKFIAEARKELKERQNKEVQEAINNFAEAWKKLKQFGEVKLNVKTVGVGEYVTRVDRLTLEVLPLE